MRGFKASELVVVVISLVLLSACSAKPVQNDSLSQRAALERWNQCLERFGSQYQGSFNSLRHTSRSICDGHRRDVLATFPSHAENQVDTILSDRTREFTTRIMQTGLGNSSPSEAQPDDL